MKSHRLCAKSLIAPAVGGKEMCVAVDGVQHCDRTVERQVSVYLNDDSKLAAGPAWRLAVLLVDAAASWTGFSDRGAAAGPP